MNFVLKMKERDGILYQDFFIDILKACAIFKDT